MVHRQTIKLVRAIGEVGGIRRHSIEGSGQHHVEGSGVEGSGLVEGSGSVEGSGIDTVLTLEEAKEKKAEKTGGVVEEKLLSLSGDFKREAKKEKKEKD
ncbi:unnamed protein product, partial [Mesorhabditis belari]|uniref:Uncharacterized protein n=1 Tax=Mesorhabditis belari TaxID=2138241 RepID=A0AAF3F990_9BILA